MAQSLHSMQVPAPFWVACSRNWSKESKKHYCMLVCITVVAPSQGSGSTSAENNADCKTLKNDPSATFIDGNCLGQQSAAKRHARIPTSDHQGHREEQENSSFQLSMGAASRKATHSLLPYRTFTPRANKPTTKPSKVVTSTIKGQQKVKQAQSPKLRLEIRVQRGRT